LSHKHSTKTTKNTHPTTNQNSASGGAYKNQDNQPPPPPHKTRGTKGKKGCLDARVHYPLLKHPTHQPPPTTPHQGVAAKKGGHRTTSPHPGPPKLRGNPSGPDSSGPNSVPNTHPAGHHPGSPPPQPMAGRAVLRTVPTRRGRFIDDSTSETPPSGPDTRRPSRVRAP
jgi:hypothetical protein